MMRPMKPYSIVLRDGKKVDAITDAALKSTEATLGYELTVVQGSYNAGGVDASAGTHDGGGVVDLLPWDYVNKIRALRRIGFAAWYRPEIPGLWGPHIHAVLIGNKKLAPVASRQVAAYLAGRDGLASNGPDRHWRPDPIPTFAWPHGRPEGKPERPVQPLSYFVDLHPKYQDGFDFKLAKRQGIAAVVIKCTEGNSLNYGDAYVQMIRRARQASLGVAVYHWLRDDSSVTSQVRNLAMNIANRDLPVFIDVELGTNGDRPKVGKAMAFTKEARSRGLNVVGMYMPRWYHRELGEPPLSSDLALWNSAYGPDIVARPSRAYRLNMSVGRWSSYGGQVPTFLQFGSGVKAGGQEVDCNAYRGPAANLNRWFDFPLPDSPPVPTPERCPTCKQPLKEN